MSVTDKVIQTSFINSSDYLTIRSEQEASKKGKLKQQKWRERNDKRDYPKLLAEIDRLEEIVILQAEQQARFWEFLKKMIKHFDDNAEWVYGFRGLKIANRLREYMGSERTQTTRSLGSH